MGPTSWKRLAIVLALASAACPIDPTIDPANKTCSSPDDLCPKGYDCFALTSTSQSTCVASCGSGDLECNPNLNPPSNVLAATPCHCTDDCACPQICVVDPYWTAQGVPTVCEDPCNDQPGMGTAGDCSDPGTVCNGASCNVNQCQDLYSPCNAAGTNDGTCLPLLPNGSGQCLQGLAPPCPPSDGVCIPTATRGDPCDLCPEGQFCEPEPGNDGGTCLDVCTPGEILTALCPDGGTCQKEYLAVPVCDSSQ